MTIFAWMLRNTNFETLGRIISIGRIKLLGLYVETLGDIE